MAAPQPVTPQQVSPEAFPSIQQQQNHGLPVKTETVGVTELQSYLSANESPGEAEGSPTGSWLRRNRQKAIIFGVVFLAIVIIIVIGVAAGVSTQHSSPSGSSTSTSNNGSGTGNSHGTTTTTTTAAAHTTTSSSSKCHPGGMQCNSSGDCSIISEFSQCKRACNGFYYCT
ncbi:hypothetical protein GCG54_00001267 [Colletotrichum gloeosporioides]|uniref:Uncharacterized protein n=1 Tax=Colletotrichum gloeosporioides TaxID=474922 RepID=A0A8H4C8Q9_COLGL|nr:uncharacterized protein GCG54_00001267 [Colletotrichum gloeosporioides]KAF3799227.1 hypothetical protein GCG54_00001267 [Colletotrichum gloeosporioides]